jgi:hypothetical protein
MEEGKKPLTDFANATAEQRKKYARRIRGASRAMAEKYSAEECLIIENVGLLKDGTAAVTLTTESGKSLTVELYNFYPLPTFNGSKEELKNFTIDNVKALTPQFEGILSEYEDTHTEIFEFGEYFKKFKNEKVVLDIEDCENVVRYYNGEYYTKSKDFYLILSLIAPAEPEPTQPVQQRRSNRNA